ncbi:Gfo/Idh/MocA family oxidoreductase [Georgenia satyanarayanai]|uniref:Gfo/Idh/MocA family protein n=1 Tax=Georgenia satyanarayanai TaxID=860221 RepID=UPI0020423FDC|nr:Gfo/Idh/MocA family oxidoreductase [Georgenia satyanarayanai]MCM3660980.1 Gfo/Idh/MocA family oxidoreductase [Georgenia satyanarayanai]
MQKVGIGVVGAGFVADLHAESFKRVAGHDAQIVAVAAPPTRRDAFAQRHGITKVYDDLEQLLTDDDVHVIDICTPPSLHVEMVTKVIEAGKHVICEKPLTGFFDVPDDGAESVDRRQMYEAVMAEMDRLREVLAGTSLVFGYAENYVYAPSVQKSREVLEKSGSRITMMIGEESHNGSHAEYSRHWKDSGGGALIRQGCHPLSAMLYLKQVEARVAGRTVAVDSVLADTTAITPTLSDEQRRFLHARPVDVEDMANVILTFDDGTRGVVTATDTIVGGVRNSLQVFTTDSVHLCQISQSDSLRLYHADAASLDDVYVTEKIDNKGGWQYVLLDELMARGYIGEMQDFIDCVVHGGTPQSDFELAYTSMQAIYAAYESAATDRRVRL